MKTGIDGPVNGTLLCMDVHLCMEFHVFILSPADDNGFVAYFVKHRYSDFPKLPAATHSDIPVSFRLYNGQPPIQQLC